MFLLMSSLNRLLIISLFHFGLILLAICSALSPFYHSLSLLSLLFCCLPQLFIVMELAENSCRGRKKAKVKCKNIREEKNNFCLWWQQFYKLFFYNFNLRFRVTFEPSSPSGADKLKRNIYFPYAFYTFSNFSNCSSLRYSIYSFIYICVYYI